MADTIPSKTKTLFAQRAGHLCEYCRTPAAYSSTRFSVEHIIPRAIGGSDAPDNLAYACQGCNNIKFTKTEAYDEESNRFVPLFNPRKDKWEEHFGWGVDLIRLIGFTPVGRATIGALRLNREEICNLRAVLFLIGGHPPS
jgi:hypothetical protein